MITGMYQLLCNASLSQSVQYFAEFVKKIHVLSWFVRKTVARSQLKHYLLILRSTMTSKRFDADREVLIKVLLLILISPVKNRP